MQEKAGGGSFHPPFLPNSSVAPEAGASISVIPGSALPSSSLWSAQLWRPSCGCRRACLVTTPEQARMYLRVLARHEQKGPGATIKGNILHSFRRKCFPGLSRPRPWMTGIPLTA